MAYGSGTGSIYETAIRQRQGSYGQPRMAQRFSNPQASQPPRSPSIRSYLDQRQAMAQPQAPSPYAGRMPMNGMATQGAGQAPMAPQSGRQAMFGDPNAGRQAMFGGGMSPATSSFDDMVRALPDNYEQQFADFSRSLDANPDYKGSHESEQMLRAQYAQMLSRLASQPDIDFSGSSEVADQFNNQRERLTADLGARGFGGSGMEAGALANSYGSQARAQGSFYRDAMEQRRKEELAQMLQFENWARGIQGQGLQRNWAEQDAPSFLDKALGVVGGIGGTLIGGALGGPMGAGIGNQIGTGLTGGRPTYYGQPQQQFGYGNQYDDADYDYGDPFGTGRNR